MKQKERAEKFLSFCLALPVEIGVTTVSFCGILDNYNHIVSKKSYEQKEKEGICCNVWRGRQFRGNSLIKKGWF